MRKLLTVFFVVGLAILFSSMRSGTNFWDWAKFEIGQFDNTVQYLQIGFPRLAKFHAFVIYALSFYGGLVLFNRIASCSLDNLFTKVITKVFLAGDDLKQNWRAYCLSVFFSIVIAIGVAEVFLRKKGEWKIYSEESTGIYNSPFSTSFIKGWCWVFAARDTNIVVNAEFTHERRTNSLGLCDQEFSAKKNPLKKRIFCIGDSFTEGVGASPDSTYPMSLQNILGDSFEVYNAGIGGSDPIFGFMLLKQKLLAYRPDEVIVTVNTSDVDDIMFRGGFERFKPDTTLEFRKAPVWEILYEKLHLVRFFVHRIFKMDYHFLNPQDSKMAFHNSTSSIERAIDSIAVLSSKENIGFKIVFHPFLGDSVTGSIPTQDVLNYCTKNHIPVINMLDSMKTGDTKPQNFAGIFWPADGHYNNQGYLLMSRIIARSFEK